MIGVTKLLFPDSSPLQGILAASPQCVGEVMCGDIVSQQMLEDPYVDNISSVTLGPYFQLSAQSKPDVHRTGGLGMWQLMGTTAQEN